MTEKLTEERTIEEGLQELDKIVEKLESRDISLEDSFAMYQKGMEVLKQCSQKIDMVEKNLPEEHGFSGRMAEAVNYSMKAGGKRLRPVLMRQPFLPLIWQRMRQSFTVWQKP